MAILNLYDIEDDDIRIIKADSSEAQSAPVKDQCVDVSERGLIVRDTRPPKRGHGKRLLIIILALILLGLALFLLYLVFFPRLSEPPRNAREEMYYAEESSLKDSLIQSDYIAYEPISRTELNAKELYTSELQDTINDIVLNILAPNATCTPELYVGELSKYPGEIVLAVQAADIRADNGEIVGDFICDGEVLAKGHPKRGFCAIVEGSIYMGCQTYTPFFEKAYDNGGYFFRQFSLVHEGMFGERTPKGKSIRRALCYKDDQIFVIETEEKESFHDFTRALIDYGVQEAISLVGSSSIIRVKSEAGTYISDSVEPQGSISYIIWRE